MIEHSTHAVQLQLAADEGQLRSAFAAEAVIRQTDVDLMISSFTRTTLHSDVPVVARFVAGPESAWPAYRSSSQRLPLLGIPLDDPMPRIPLISCAPRSPVTWQLCYIVSMKRPKQRRAGATETFSVSVDPATKRALRALAKAEYGGNMSALVTALAEEARRRTSAGAYLRRHKLPALDQAEVSAVEAELEREIAALRQPRRRRRVA